LCQTRNEVKRDGFQVKQTPGQQKGKRIADRKDSKIDSNRKEGNTAMYLMVDRMGGR
jgi:hypothetical protein